MNIKTTFLALILIAFGYTGRSQTLTSYNNVVIRFQQFYNQDMEDSIFSMFSDHLKEFLSVRQNH